MSFTQRLPISLSLALLASVEGCPRGPGDGGASDGAWDGSSPTSDAASASADASVAVDASANSVDAVVIGTDASGVDAALADAQRPVDAGGGGCPVDGTPCGPGGSFCCHGLCCAECGMTVCHVAVTCSGTPDGTEYLLPDGGFQMTSVCCGGQGTDLTSDPKNCSRCGKACAAGQSCRSGQCIFACAGADGDACDLGAGATGQCCRGACCAGSCESGGCYAASCLGLPDMSSCGHAGGGLRCCGGGCVDTLSDPLHCGDCGRPCGGSDRCYGGQCGPAVCTPAGAGRPCQRGDAGMQTQTCCASGCTTLAADPSNCGGCGQVCPAGALCKVGGCSSPDGGVARCSSTSCPSGFACEGQSQSVCLSLTCPAGGSGDKCAYGPWSPSLSSAGLAIEGSCCSGVCAHAYQGDPHNCFQCGCSCASGICAAGYCDSCLGAPTMVTCSSTAQMNMPCKAGAAKGFCCLVAGVNPPSVTCADIATDPANCGGCGLPCPSAQTCDQGLCSGAAPPCEAGRLFSYCGTAGSSSVCCAGGGCSDPTTDSQNCGACGHPCPAGDSCVQGQCWALTCGPGSDYQPCPLDAGAGACCSGACADLASDPDHCGDCPIRCPTTETCRDQKCGVDVCTPADNGNPCHLGALTGKCCNSSCINTKTDPLNCGGCNLPCPPDAGCVNGNCI